MSFQRLCLFLLSALLWSVTAAFGHPSETGEIEWIPLSTETVQGEILPFLQLEVDGETETVLLDTGAPTTCLLKSKSSLRFSALEATETIGVSGQPSGAVMIEPEQVRIGRRTFHRPRLKRTEAGKSLVGLDLVGNQVFRVDLAQSRLGFLPGLPHPGHSQPLRRLSGGHIIVPLQFDTNATSALFDTGASTTVIDIAYVKEHPQDFRALRTSSGRDANGNPVDSDVYLCKELRIGSLVLTDVEVTAFDFGDYLRGKMENVPMILGNNVISKAVWTFDLAGNRWTQSASGMDSAKD